MSSSVCYGVLRVVVWREYRVMVNEFGDQSLRFCIGGTSGSYRCSSNSSEARKKKEIEKNSHGYNDIAVLSTKYYEYVFLYRHKYSRLREVLP